MISGDYVNRLQQLLLVAQNAPGWYVAMDCEMVGTGPNGSQSSLARVSIVDWNGYPIIDAFVQFPEGVKVTDYRTEVSGITPNDLSNENENAFALEDIRYIVQCILHQKILIGHGLDNDLSALMISHPPECIRDTARYIPYMRPHKPCPSGSSPSELMHTTKSDRKLEPRKLKDLAKERLGICIQENGRSHSSLEDARAALALYKQARPEWEAFVSRSHREQVRKQNKRTTKPKGKKSSGRVQQAVAPVLTSTPCHYVEDQRDPDHTRWSSHNNHQTHRQTQFQYQYSL